MQEFEITSRRIKDDQGNLRIFRYTLLVEQVEAGKFFCENYGVQISEDGGTCTALPGITTSASRIDELMERLVAHRVGPSGLSDVVSDWL